MDNFIYKNGSLFVEQLGISQIIETVGSPAYIYSKATFLDHLTKIQNAYREIDTTVCFSIKACSNIHILKFMADAGSGFDIVSGGELYRAMQTSVKSEKIMYAGVGKTDAEIIEALNANVGYFNIESEAEMQNLIRLAKLHNKKTKAALRVNPDVDYKTHAYITTGKKENKFGVSIDNALRFFEQYSNNGSVDLCAIHLHLGSGGKKIDPYVEAVEKILPLIHQLRKDGHKIETIDLGGGYGADYESDTVPSAAEYASGIVPLLKNKGLKLILEPGKAICANASVLISQVLYTKTAGSKKFIIVDAGMNDLIRPALYDAFHFIWPVNVESQFIPAKRSKELDFAGTEMVDIVGPICESSDFFAKDRKIPPVKRGDLLCIFTAGAYGFTMSSNYNSRCKVPEILVDGTEFSIIRKRESYRDLLGLEI